MPLQWKSNVIVMEAKCNCMEVKSNCMEVKSNCMEVKSNRNGSKM